MNIENHTHYHERHTAMKSRKKNKSPIPLTEFFPVEVRMKTDAEISELSDLYGQPEGEVRGFLEETIRKSTIYQNNLYMVFKRVISKEDSSFFCDVTWLSIKRNDKHQITNWRALQQIKNMIMGEEVEAVQMFPKESRKVDSANQYHLWCLAEGEVFPFGWFQGRYVNDFQSSLIGQTKGAW